MDAPSELHEPTHYDRLGLDTSATPEAIEQRYQALKARTGILTPRDERALDRAYAVLSHPQRRRRYDQGLSTGTPDTSAPAASEAPATGDPATGAGSGAAGSRPEAAGPPAPLTGTPCWRGNERRTGEIPSMLVRSAELEWRVMLPQGASCAPVCGHGLVYVGTRDGLLHAFDGSGSKPADGTFPRVLSGGMVLAPPLVTEDALIVVTAGGMVHRLEPRTGGDLSEGLMLGEPVMAAPLLRDDMLLVATTQGRMRAIKASTLTPIWCWPSEDQPALEAFVASPVALGPLVVVVTRTGLVIALDPWHHEGPVEAWRVDLGEDHMATPLARSRDVCLYGTSGTLTTIRDDGYVICRQNIIRALVEGSPTTWGGNKLFIGAANDGLYAQDPLTGEGVPGYPLRNQQGGQMVDAITTSPLCLGDLVLYGGAAGYVYGVKASDAKVIWSYRMGEPMVGSPGCSAERIHVATRGEPHGTLFSFRSTVETV